MSQTQIHQLCPQSMTSIAAPPQENKLEGVIERLQQRRRVLEGMVGGDGGRGNERAQLEARRVKYGGRLAVQRREVGRLQEKIKEAEENIFKIVLQLQQTEVHLSSLSGQASTLSRHSFGLYHPSSYSSPKWLSTHLLTLQSQLHNPELTLCRVLSTFYYKQMNLQGYQYLMPAITPLQWLLQEKKVNKLYGVLLQDGRYRGSEESAEGNEAESEDQVGIMGKEDHDTWLQMLKVLKSLEKLQAETQGNNKSASVTLFKKQLTSIINEANRLKSQAKDTKAQLTHLHELKNQLTQQLSIKLQLIDSLQAKLNAITARLATLPKEQPGNPEHIENCRKQLKELDEAILYFNIKKKSGKINSSATTIRQVEGSSGKTKTLGDVSTCLMTSCKSLLGASPDVARRGSGRKCIRQLLSPPKYLSSLEKRRAWK